MSIKNIVVINDFAHINGGAGQVALTSAMGLARQGYNVVLVSAVGPVMPGLISAGVRVFMTGQYEIAKDSNRLRAVYQGIWNISARRMLGKVLAGFDSSNTVVHIHGWSKALSSSVIEIAVRRGFKVVCTLHDYFVACPNGGFFDYRKQSICNRTPLSASCIVANCDVRNYPQKIWRVARQVVQEKMGRLREGVRHYIFISEFSKSVLLPFMPKGAHFYHVSNPIDVNREGRVDVAANQTIVYVGRLSPEKGVLILAEAARRANLRILFVGEGECASEITKIAPDARITGWVPKQEVLTYLRTARMLVLPSLWYETQGLVVAEAAALGIPAIVPDTCAAKDMVLDGTTGLWFKGGNTEDLEAKIRMLDQNSFLAESLGKCAYERYWQSPSTMSSHLDGLLGCYSAILAKQD